MGHLAQVKGTLGHTGAETGPYSGPPRGAVRHCRARPQPPAPRGRLHTPGSDVSAQHRFKVAIQHGGCWLHKGAFITQLGSQPCSGSPWCTEVPEGGVCDPRASPGSGVGASGSFHSSSGRASDVTLQLLPQHQGPSHSPLSRRPLKPPQGHQCQALRTQVGARGAGRGTSGLAGPDQALCIITYNQSFQEAGCWPTNPGPPELLFLHERQSSNTRLA